MDKRARDLFDLSFSDPEFDKKFNEINNNNIKKMKWLGKWLLAVVIWWIVGCIGLLVLVIYVAGHFIAKWW